MYLVGQFSDTTRIFFPLMEILKMKWEGGKQREKGKRRGVSKF